jgi:EmrB/QacA subfamily drug resistance transporter
MGPQIIIATVTTFMTDSSALASAPTDAVGRRQWAALIVVCVGTLMIVLDTTIVNVALPVIKDDLGFSQSALTWIVNAYLISFGSFLLVAGRLGDMFGRKRVFLIGLVVFVAASALCGISTNQETLIAGRFIQGLGGALASASVLAIIVTEFPKGAAQARAMGVYTFVAIAGGSIGLLIGGVLTESFSWHWIFFINVPIGIFTYFAGIKLIDESARHAIGEKIDYLGAVLVTIGVAVGVYAIVGATEHGWASVQTLGLGALSLALLSAFLVLESRIEHPIMPLRILRVRSLMYSNLIRGALVVAMFAVFFLGALYLEQVKGYDAKKIGFAFLPMTIVMGGLSLGPTAKLMGRFGTTKLVLAALPPMAVALVVLSTADANTGYFPLIGGVFAVLGLGMGLSFAPLVALGMRDIGEADAGLASGLVNVAQQLAGAFGLAILSTLAADRTKSAIADGTAKVPAFVEGFQLACIVSAVVVVVGVALVLLAARESQSAEQKAGEAVTDAV